jgi:membrane-bound metal-dependent hydrolase YbcI (DUF457 family)
MANFQTHITTSSLLGAVYAGAGYSVGMPLPSSIVAAGLCSLSGMLPDLDSESGIPVRETMRFAAAICPILMLDRFQHMGLTTEEIVIASTAIYFTVRYGVAWFFRHYTVHRGMWHSLPAACMATLIGYLVSSGANETIHIYKAGGVFVGFMSHLILDEFYSVEMRRGRLRIKRSMGTALKLWSRNTWANVSTYAKLIILLALAFGDAHYFHAYFDKYEHKFNSARQAMEDRIEQRRDEWMR